MHGIKIACAGLLLAGCGEAPLSSTPLHLIPGEVYLDNRGPDGNTIILDAPRGLIVVDSGRHPAHAQTILAHVKSLGKPVAAIINTHWHLDHTTGNLDLRKAFPAAEIIASRAIEGQLFRDFIAPGREKTRKALAEGTAPVAQRPQMIRAQAFLNDLHVARPTRPVVRSGAMLVAGRRIDIRLAPFAASEGDVWLIVPEEKTVIAGDLVVDIVPFMDTACVDGWVKALDEIAEVDFERLIPGHGAAMTKPQFLQWKKAFDAFVECGRSNAEAKACVEGWAAAAAPFIGAAHRNYANDAAAYYLDTRLRSKPEEQKRFCAVPKG